MRKFEELQKYMPKPVIDVSIGILLHKNKVLIGWREASQHQGNKHEFPGGKVEHNESPVDACRREIYEEVGVGIKEWHVFDQVTHEYDDVIVKLHLFHAFVPDELLALIHQPWSWFGRDQLKNLNFPKANDAILQRLSWPHYIKISELPPNFSSDRLQYWRSQDAVQQNIKQVLEHMSEAQLSALIINQDQWQRLDHNLQEQIKTIHLKQHQLMQLKQGDLVVSKRYIAACHDLVAINHAHKLGCDAVFISPVQPTPTHPEAVTLGWDGLAQMAQHSHIPVFALGGLHPDDLEQAVKHGAYGVAGIRNF